MALRLTLALLMLAVTIVVAGRRVGWLTRLIRSGQPAPGRTDKMGERLRAQLVEVFGQTSAASLVGAGYRALLHVLGLHRARPHDRRGLRRAGDQRGLRDPVLRSCPVAGLPRGLLRGRGAGRRSSSSPSSGCVNAPDREHRASRFYGSHTGPAWVILGMITLVIVTLLLYRGAQYNTGHFPFGTSKAPFASYAVAQLLGDGAYNQGVETFFLLAQMAVIFGFAIIVVYSKHLHIAIAPLNVTTKRLPDGLGPLLPVADDEGRADRLRRCREPVARTPCSAGARSRTSPGRDTSTSRPAPSAGAASPSARPGTPDKPLSPKLRDHGPARPPVRQGSLPPRREDGAGRRAGPGRSRRGSAGRFASGPGGRLPAAGRLRPGSSAAAPGRRRRIVRRHRPRRAVVVHHLRGVRRAVPGRHRAHRPHRRHAPLPGADRVGVPVRGRRDAAQPGEQGQPVGPGRSRPRGVDRRTRLRGAARHPRRAAARRHRLPVLGRLRRRAGGPVEEGHPGRSPNCCTPPA